MQSEPPGSGPIRRLPSENNGKEGRKEGAKDREREMRKEAAPQERRETASARQQSACLATGAGI